MLKHFVVSKKDIKTNSDLKLVAYIAEQTCKELKQDFHIDYSGYSTCEYLAVKYIDNKFVLSCFKLEDYVKNKNIILGEILSLNKIRERFASYAEAKLKDRSFIDA